MLSIFEEAKEIIYYYSQRTVRVLQIYFTLIQYHHKMAQYYTLKVKLSNSQLSKSKSAMKKMVLD